MDLEARIQKLPEVMQDHIRLLGRNPALADDPGVIENEVDFFEKLAAKTCPSCGGGEIKVSRKKVPNRMTWICSSCEHETTL